MITAKHRCATARVRRHRHQNLLMGRRKGFVFSVAKVRLVGDDIRLHDHETVGHDDQSGRVQSHCNLPLELATMLAEVVQDLGGRRSQPETPHLAILRIGAALDEATPLQAIDETSDRGRLERKAGSEGYLRQTRPTRERGEDDPLGVSDTAPLRELIRPLAHPVDHIIEKSQQVAIDGVPHRKLPRDRR